MPNIKGKLLIDKKDIRKVAGAFSNLRYEAPSAGCWSANGSAVDGYNVTDFDASLSNSIYGTSGTVQPPAIQLIPQIKY